jgi:hypothetical protein
LFAHVFFCLLYSFEGRLNASLLRQVRFECEMLRERLSETTSLNRELEAPPPCPVEEGVATPIERADPAAAATLLDNRLRDEALFASEDIAAAERPCIDFVALTSKNAQGMDFPSLTVYLQALHDAVVRLREEYEAEHGCLEALSLIRVVFCKTLVDVVPNGDAATVWSTAQSEKQRDLGLTLLSTLIAHFAVAVAALASADRAERSSNVIAGTVLWVCFEAVLRSNPTTDDVARPFPSAFRDLLNGTTRVKSHAQYKSQAGFAFYTDFTDDGGEYTFDSLEVTGMLPCEAPSFAKARSRAAHHLQMMRETYRGKKLYDLYRKQPPGDDQKISCRVSSIDDPTICFTDALCRATKSGMYDPLASGIEADCKRAEKAYRAIALEADVGIQASSFQGSDFHDAGEQKKYKMLAYAPGGGCNYGQANRSQREMFKYSLGSSSGWTRIVEQFTQKDQRMTWFSADSYRFPACPPPENGMVPAILRRHNDEPYFAECSHLDAEAAFGNKLAVNAPDHYMARDALLLLKALVFEFPTKKSVGFSPMIPAPGTGELYTTLDLAKKGKVAWHATVYKCPCNTGGVTYDVTMKVLGKLCRFGEQRVNDGPPRSPASLESPNFSLRATLPPGHPARGKIQFNTPAVKKLNEVHVEDDVLHAFALPLFDGKLSAEDSEALLTSLTCPYIRIPLVLRFFASGNVSRLFHVQLRELIHATLFEPHLWSSEGRASQADPRLSISTVPVKPTAHARKALACDDGLLMKEMTHSCDAVVKSLAVLLAAALDIAGDEFEAESVEICLYLIRLSVLVERFAVAALDAGGQRSTALRAMSKLLRAEGSHSVRSALRGWSRGAEGACAAERKTPLICIFKAHTMMLFTSCKFDEGNADQQRRDLTECLGALLYVSTYHEFGRATEVEASAMDAHDRDPLARALLRRPTPERRAEFDEQRGQGSAAKVLAAAGKLSKYAATVAACGTGSDEAAASLLCGDALFLECVGSLRESLVTSMRRTDQYTVILNVVRDCFRDPTLELGKVISEDAASPGVWQVRAKAGGPVRIALSIQTARISSGGSTTQAVPSAFVRNEAYKQTFDSTPHCTVVSGGEGSSRRRIFIDTLGSELTLWAPPKVKEMAMLPGGVAIKTMQGSKIKEVTFEGACTQRSSTHLLTPTHALHC